MGRKITIALIFFVCVLAFLRIYVSTTVAYASDDVSYQNVRHAQMMQESKAIIRIDPLSFGGRELVYNPVSVGLLALLYRPDSIIWYKIILNIFAALLTVAFFLVGYELCQNYYHAFAGAIIGSFIPLYYLLTINSITIIPIFLCILFFALAAYLRNVRTNTTTSLVFAISLLSIASLLHPLFLVIFLGFVFYLLLALTEKKTTHPREKEIVFVISLITFIVNYAIYYKSLIEHGFLIFMQQTLYSSYVSFSQIISLLPQIGLVLFAIALFVVHHMYVQQKQTYYLLPACIGIVSIVLMLLQSLSAELGLLLVSVCSVTYVAPFLTIFSNYLQKTKIAKHTVPIISVVCMLILLSILVPTIVYTNATILSSTDPALVEAYVWIKEHAPQNAYVVVPLSQANAAMYFSNRSTIMDSNTLLVLDAQNRKQLLDEFYQTQSKAAAIEILTQLGITKNVPAYIVLDKPKSDLTSSYQRMIFLESDCFLLAYNAPKIQVYQSLCEATQ